MDESDLEKYACDICKRVKPFDQIAEIFSKGSCTPFSTMSVVCHECKKSQNQEPTQ